MSQRSSKKDLFIGLTLFVISILFTGCSQILHSAYLERGVGGRFLSGVINGYFLFGIWIPLVCYVMVALNLFSKRNLPPVNLSEDFTLFRKTIKSALKTRLWITPLFFLFIPIIAARWGDSGYGFWAMLTGVVVSPEIRSVYVMELKGIIPLYQKCISESLSLNGQWFPHSLGLLCGLLLRVFLFVNMGLHQIINSEKTYPLSYSKWRKMSASHGNKSNEKQLSQKDVFDALLAMEEEYAQLEEIKNIREDSYLEKVLCKETLSNKVRLKAYERISSKSTRARYQDFINKVALKDPLDENRLFAVQRLKKSPQDLFKQIALNDSNHKIRKIAFKRISKAEIWEEILESDPPEDIRKLAEFRINPTKENSTPTAKSGSTETGALDRAPEAEPSVAEEIFVLACPSVSCDGRISSRDGNLRVLLSQLSRGAMVSGGTVPCNDCGCSSALTDWHRKTSEVFGHNYLERGSEIFRELTGAGADTDKKNIKCEHCGHSFNAENRASQFPERAMVIEAIFGPGQAFVYQCPNCNRTESVAKVLIP